MGLVFSGAREGGGRIVLFKTLVIEQLHTLVNEALATVLCS